MSQSLPQGRFRPLFARNRTPAARSPHRLLGLAAVALIAGFVFTKSARADIWGYVDEGGRTHLASDKLDDRYSLFFKGGVRVDQPTGQIQSLPNSVASSAAPTSAGSDSATASASASKVVASDAAAAPRQLPASVAHFEPLINQYAKMHSIDPALVKAVIAVESAFQPGVVSAKGALGLMQIIPDTGARYGVTGDRKQSVKQKLFDPATNLKVGTRYLRDLLGMFAQNIELALAAYNAGEGSVMKYKNTVPPFAETREYVNKVQKLYADYKPAGKLAAASVAPTQASTQPSGPVKGQLLLPGQRVPHSGLVPVAADMSMSVYPTALPAATLMSNGTPSI